MHGWTLQMGGSYQELDVTPQRLQGPGKLVTVEDEALAHGVLDCLALPDVANQATLLNTISNEYIVLVHRDVGDLSVVGVESNADWLACFRRLRGARLTASIFLSTKRCVR